MIAKIHAAAVLVLSLVFLSGCLSVGLPDLQRQSSELQLPPETLARFIVAGPPPRSVLPSTTVPTRTLQMPRVGEKNPYGVPTTPELELAYDTYLGGDGEAALLALEAAEIRAVEMGTLWQISFLRVQILMMMGRSADAETEIERTLELEKSVMGHSMNSLALRSEIQIWLGNFVDVIGDEDDENEAVQELTSGLAPQTWAVGRMLYFVPADALHFVPWGVFDLKTPVVVLPNGGWLLRQPKPIVSETPVVIASDPEFGGELVPLAGAPKEAERLGELYQVTPLLGRQATEAALRQRLGRGVRILHLVTHGEFSSRDPLDSTIFLSRGERAYALTARAIFEQPLPAQFVVRSGCETGMGRRVSGEDLLGLTRSFYLGGTLAVLSSLWTIEDEGPASSWRFFTRRRAEEIWQRLGSRQGTLSERRATLHPSMAPLCWAVPTSCKEAEES